nr:hypothetical protein [Bacteroidota bacterium]
MKIFALFLFLSLPTVTFAQNYQGMGGANMENMMQQMQKMQKCMENVDQEKIKALEQRSSQFEAEIKSLCSEGKRDKAQEQAISFGKDIAKDSTLHKMRDCGKLMKGMIPQMPYMDQEFTDTGDHVCD